MSRILSGTAPHITAKARVALTPATAWIEANYDDLRGPWTPYAGRLGMSYHLSFTELASYDPGQARLTVVVTLSLSHDRVSCEAKIDTGASLCIFARDLGEKLGLDVESGMRQLFGTVTGDFVV